MYKGVTMEDTLKQNLKEPERNLYGITYKEDYVTHVIFIHTNTIEYTILIKNIR